MDFFPIETSLLSTFLYYITLHKDTATIINFWTFFPSVLLFHHNYYSAHESTYPTHKKSHEIFVTKSTFQLQFDSPTNFNGPHHIHNDLLRLFCWPCLFVKFQHITYLKTFKKSVEILENFKSYLAKKSTTSLQSGHFFDYF